MELVMLGCQHGLKTIPNATFGQLLDRVLEGPESAVFLLSVEEGKELMRLCKQLNDRLSKTEDIDEKDRIYKNFTDENERNWPMYVIAIGMHPQISRHYKTACVDMMAYVGCYVAFYADPLLVQRRANAIHKEILKSREDSRKYASLS